MVPVTLFSHLATTEHSDSRCVPTAFVGAQHRPGRGVVYAGDAFFSRDTWDMIYSTEKIMELI